MNELKTLELAAVRQGKKGFYGPLAVVVNERILELDPGNVAALLRLARCHTEGRKWRAAEEVYGRLNTLGVGEPRRLQERIREMRGLADAEEAAKRQAEERERKAKEQAEQEQRQLLEDARAEAAEVDSFLDARSLAIAYREAREHVVALIYHERSLELATSTSDKTGALAAHASTLRAAGRAEEALIALRESIAVEPSRSGNKHSYTSLVATLRELGKLDEARQEGEALLDLYEADAWVLFALGRVLKELARRDRDFDLAERALEYYDRASKLRPGERNILAELKSLVGVYDMLSAQLSDPGIAEKARELERQIGLIEPKLVRRLSADQ